MDNTDQRTFETQQEAFLIAQELSATRNLLVFIALRPSTFYNSKQKGALSGYQNKILTISPPPADQVVLKRLTFAVRLAEGKENLDTLNGIQLKLDNVAYFFKATLRAIKTSKAVQQFLNNISGGNTRAILELISGFCGSPNVDAAKIIRIEEETNNYVIPIHEFSKHALLGDYSYFNEESSLLACNIFDITSADVREHFLSSIIIAYLCSNAATKDKGGFIKGELLVHEMMTHQFSEEQTRTTLIKLAEKRLIETPHSHYREVEVDLKDLPDIYTYRATSIGVYHIKNWSGTFQFLDATSTDTPIFEEQCTEIVCKLAASFDIKDRQNKVLAFKKYLEKQWYASNLDPDYYNFPDLLESQNESFYGVQRAIDRLRKF